MNANNEIIKYTKGVDRTRTLVPTEKKPIDKGSIGTIYILLNAPNFVVKKSNTSLKNEFRIAQRLNHFTFCKAYKLYIKLTPYGKVYKLVMEKIEGILFDNLKRKRVVLETEIILKLMKETLEAAISLQQARVGWKDLHDKNMFLINDDSIKFCDFEWNDHLEGNPYLCSTQIVEGLKVLFTSILDVSAIARSPIKRLFRSPQLLPNYTVLKQAKSDIERIQFIRKYGELLIQETRARIIAHQKSLKTVH